MWGKGGLSALTGTVAPGIQIFTAPQSPLKRLLRSLKGPLTFWMAVQIWFPAAVCAETSNQPYIDQLKNEIKSENGGKEEPVSNSPDPYIESIKKKLDAQEAEKEAEKGAEKDAEKDGNYIEELKKSDPSLREEPPTQSFIEQERIKLPPSSEGGAIQAVAEGKSELHPQIKGDIHSAFGAKYGVSLSRAITSSSELRNFNDIYGSSYAPDLTLFYEYQPFHSEWFGNIGIIGMGG